MDERADKRVAACVEMLQRSMTVRSICTALRMSPVTVQAIKKSANPVEYRIKKAGRRPVITPEMHQFIDANLPSSRYKWRTLQHTFPYSLKYVKSDHICLKIHNSKRPHAFASQAQTFRQAHDRGQ